MYHQLIIFFLATFEHVVSHIGSIDKLAKKLGKESRGEVWEKESIAFLMSLGVDEDGADDILTALKKSHFSAPSPPSVMRFDDDENRIDDMTLLPSIKALEEEDNNDNNDSPLIPTPPVPSPLVSDEKSSTLTNTDVLTQSITPSPSKTNTSRHGSVHGYGNDTTRSSTHSTHSTNSVDRASFDRSSLKEPLKVLEGNEDKNIGGHQGSVMCLIQLEDGRICSGGGTNDTTIRIWKQKGKCDVTLNGWSITNMPS